MIEEDMRTTAKKAPKRVKHRIQKPVTDLVHVAGRLERGKVKLSQPVAWSEGQVVVVIPLPPSLTAENAGVPTLEELEEDAKEFVPRPGTLGAINRSELE
jgi:hypothetical protein